MTKNQCRITGQLSVSIWNVGVSPGRPVGFMGRPALGLRKRFHGGERGVCN